MAVSVKNNGAKTTTYNVKGKTLADVWKDITKKGPKDPNNGKVYAGLCKCEVDKKATKVTPKGTVKNVKGAFEAELRASGGTVVYGCTITMPNNTEAAKLSAKAKKEWNRYLKAVQTHENGHVTEYGKEIATMIKEIEAIKVVGKGDSKEAAVEDAKKKLDALWKKDFGEAANDKRLNANAVAYDKKTKHGESQGAKLDTSIT